MVKNSLNFVKKNRQKKFLKKIRHKKFVKKIRQKISKTHQKFVKNKYSPSTPKTSNTKVSLK